MIITLKEILIVGLCLFFELSGVTKLYSLEAFTNVVAESVGTTYALHVSILICFSEIVIGIIILIDKYQYYTLASIILIMLVFTLYQIDAMAKNVVTENCMCFGTVIEERIGVSTISRNLVVIIISLSLLQSKQNIIITKKAKV